MWDNSCEVTYGKVDECEAGCIAGEAYDHAGRTNYALFLPMIHDGVIFQDDWAFSHRARQSGFSLWDDFGCRLKHFCGDFLGFDEVATERP